MERAFQDLSEDAERPGVRTDGALGRHLRLYHCRHARNRVAPRDRIGRPRHILVFRLDAEVVEIVRILHDAMDIPRHLEESLDD